MTRLLPLALLSLAACAPAILATDIPFFGTGYRADGDPCRRVGESGFTNQFLSDSADLVGCPADQENLGVFVAETGAVLVAEMGAYNLYSVPLR